MFATNLSPYHRDVRNNIYALGHNLRFHTVWIRTDIQQVSHLDTEMGLIRGRAPAQRRSIVRTLADLKGVDGVNWLHIAEAPPYRGQMPGRG